MLSLRPSTARFDSPEQISMDVYREIDVRQAEFFMFLDSELEKIDEFYKQKEEEATVRLKVLREQLHIMRDRRLDEVVHSQMTKNHKGSAHRSDRQLSARTDEGDPLINGDDRRGKALHWLRPVHRVLGRATAVHVGKTFEVMKELGTPSGPSALDLTRDYTKKPYNHAPPYRQAKHKLKIAMAEYYRGLELLKSYALMNRTAFRKINKKFDKTVSARPTGRYMSEKVNKAHFFNSEIIEGHIQAVEDLYARYFERGSHKVAVGKLRAKIARAGDYTGSVFRNGILLAIGAVFGIEGLVYASERLYSPDTTTATLTSYLLQVSEIGPYGDV